MSQPPRMRPEFTVPLAEPHDFFPALQRALDEQGAPCRGTLFGEGAAAAAILRRHDQDQHVWSPALHLDLVADAHGALQLHGRFSPSSPVWTAFLAIYLALTCVGIASACYGGAQLVNGDAPWAFVGVGVAVALAGFTYGAAFIGQGLGSEDMYELRRFVDLVVGGS